MGCCSSCLNHDDHKESDDEDQSPRRPLLDPVRDGGSSGSMTGYNSTSDRVQQKGDEQSALNRILHETAGNVIDVAALESQPMDQHEYLDRARTYSQRLAVRGRQRPPQQRLPVGIAAPQAVLASQPISQADVQLITNAAQQASKALKEVKVRHKEDLVVPFGVP